MSYRSNENQYLPARPLRQLSAKQFTFNSKHERTISHSDNQLEAYKTQIHNLRIRCAKIDQIEKYANILLQTVESYKAKSQEMHKQNMQQLVLIEQLRNQLHRLHGKVESKEQTLRLESLRDMEKKKVEIQQTFTAIKWQQELLNQRQSKEKILMSLDAKYKDEINRLKQVMKAAEIKMHEELTVWKKEGELTAKENTILRASVEELQHSLKIKEDEVKQLVQEIQKHAANSNSLQSQLNHRDNLIAQIQHDSLKTIDALDREVDTLKIERDAINNEKMNLERLSQQLKGEGASLIAETAVMKQKILELEEVRYANSRLIETLEGEMAQLKNSNALLQANLLQIQTNYKQLSAVLQKDNLQLRKTTQSMSLEISTKQKQIQDLIVIVSQVQNSARSAQKSAIQHQQANIKLSHRVRQLQQVLQRQTADMSHFRSRLAEAQRYAGQTQQNYVQVKGKLMELELAYQNQKKMIREYDHLIVEENEKIKMGEVENQRLMKEIAQLQKILFQGKEGFGNIEAKYQNQIEELEQRQHKIRQLQNLVGLLQTQVIQLKHERQAEKARFQQEKRLEAQDALEKMQKIVSEKYEEILKQKNDHFKSKIAYLESELSLLRKEEAEQQQIDE